jgi:hypothetical protein
MNVIYHVEGDVQGSVFAIIFLIVGVGVATLVLIFVGSLGGQTYNLVEPDIDAISNDSIKNYTKDGIISSFKALKSTGSYLPIIVLAVVIFIVLGLVIGMTGITGPMRGYGGGGYYGGAL